MCPLELEGGDLPKEAVFIRSTISYKKKALFTV